MRSLLTRLLLIAAVAVVPALILQVYSGREVREQLVRDEALRLVGLVSAAQQEVVTGAEQVLTTLSATPVVQSSGQATCRILLSNLLALSPRYRAVVIIGLDGHRRCSSAPSPPDDDLSDRGYFRQALRTNGFVVGDFTTGRLSGAPTIHMAQPFRDAQGQVAGVVALGIDLDWLGQALAALPLPPGASTTILDRNGTFLARVPDGTRFVGQPMQERYRAFLDADGPMVTPVQSIDGHSRIVAYTPVGTSARRLIVLVGLDPAVTLLPGALAGWVGLLPIGAAAAAALALAAFMGTRLIRRPVAQLLLAAERWRSGDLAARPDVPRDDSEFGRLATALEEMAVAVQQREQALHTALESTPDAVIVFDRDWRYTYMNANAKAQTGRDLIGQVIWQANPETVGTRLHAAMIEAMETGQPVQADVFSIVLQRHLQTNIYPSPAGLTVYCRDLTEQRRLQAALRESEALFRAAFDQASVGMVLTDADHKALRVNEKFCELIGYTADELIGQTSDSFTHPEDLERDRWRHASTAAGEADTIAVTKRYLRKDGTVVWVNLIGGILRDPGISNARYFTVVEDVTERIATEAALRQNEEQLRLATQAARLGIRDRDVLTGTVTWTPEAERLFGPDYNRAPTFEAWLNGVHPDDQAHVRTNWDHALSVPDAEVDHEFRFRNANGGWYWIRSNLRVIFQAGRPVRTLNVLQDITGRKESEAILAQTTALMRAVGNSSAEAIYAKDNEGRFLYVNPAVQTIIGRSAEQVIGQTDAAWLTDPDKVAIIMANDRHVIASDTIQVMEETCDTADRGTRVFRSAKSPLRLDDGTVIGVVGVSTDITDIKASEDALRRVRAGLEVRVREEVAAREAAQARAAHAERMQALGQLAGGIAHDFNNVLQAVSGAIMLMQRRPDDKAAIQRLARLAAEATERGAAITRRLLAFGRRGDLRSSTIDAAVLLTDLREILVHSLGARIDVQVYLGAGLRPFVSDKSQLETTLINLATNARDAMPDGGTLVLSASAETVEADAHPAGLDPGRYVRLSVQDTGCGMDSATLARASEPFFTTKQVGQGTGLGLAMSKGFAEQSGGGMRVESVLGQGTVVTLWLPETDPADVRVAPHPGAASRPAEAGAGKACRVLLVDDQDAVREILAMSLQAEGYSVLAAAGGTEALALLAAGELIDAVVTDLSMPGMDGLAVIRAVQAEKPQVPAVLLTGYAGDGAALALGGSVPGRFSLLRKPVRGAALTDCLDALLAGSAVGTR